MKDIKGYEGLYAITSCGKVWSYRSKKFLKPRITIYGYERVALYKDGEPKDYSVHRLVAETYIPNPESKPQVNHKNEDKTFNCINNLEWVSILENNTYGTRVERMRKSQLGKHTKKVMCVETNEIFNSISDASISVNRSISAISHCLNGHSKTCGGYHWKYFFEEVVE